MVGPVEIYLSLAGVVDSAEERARLEKDLAETESQIARLEKLLAQRLCQQSAGSGCAEGARKAGLLTRKRLKK